MQVYSAVILYRGMGWILSVILLLHLISWLGCGHGHDVFLDSLKTEGIADERQLVDGGNSDNTPPDETEVEQNQSATQDAESGEWRQKDVHV
eukprot:scaffold1332_cov166-Amphora_coffeaeformis.AAC.13